MKIFFTILFLTIISVGSNNKNNPEQNFIVENFKIKSVSSLSANSITTDSDLINRINEIQKIPFRTLSFKGTKVDSITWNCGDSLYWEIARLGEKAIPQLISKIQDKTKTDIQIQCKESNLTVGTVAFMILNEIISIPYFLVFQTRWDVLDTNCNFGYPIGLLEYINTYPQIAQEKLTKWYRKYGKKIKKKNLSSSNQNDCQKAFNINYKLKIKY